MPGKQKIINSSSLDVEKYIFFYKYIDYFMWGVAICDNMWSCEQRHV